MKRIRIISWAAAILSAAVFFFTVGPAHALLSVSAVPGMDRDMAPSQCQAACTPQFSPLLHDSKLRTGIEKDDEPLPTVEPYYAAFLNLAYTASIVPAFYLLLHLLWRPPDLVKLYGRYRI